MPPPRRRGVRDPRFLVYRGRAETRYGARWYAGSAALRRGEAVDAGLERRKAEHVDGRGAGHWLRAQTCSHHAFEALRVCNSRPERWRDGQKENATNLRDWDAIVHKQFRKIPRSYYESLASGFEGRLRKLKERKGQRLSK